MLALRALRTGVSSAGFVARRCLSSSSPVAIAGSMPRGRYPAYTPLLGEQLPPGPLALTVDQALAITETVNSVLEFGTLAQKRFQNISDADFNPGVKFQLLMETIVEVRGWEMESLRPERGCFSYC
jgi:hypothetical protein